MIDTPNHQPLSPAAQAVLNAAFDHWPGGHNHPHKRVCIAAALRAAVGQARTNPNLKRQIARREAEMLTLNKILAIAAELETSV